MDSAQIFIAFGAVMLVIALLGVVIDWFGKPLRHRRFVPKVYRFPDERQPRRSKVRETPWSSAAFVLPVVEQTEPEMLVRYPDQGAGGQIAQAPAALAVGGVDPGPPTTQVSPVDLEDLDYTTDSLAESAPRLVTVEEHAAGGSGQDPDTNSRGSAWEPGDYVFNPTTAGTSPSSTTVRTRYWRNVAAAGGASIFGVSNMERMQQGKPPERTNPRTGKVEVMRLPDAANTDGAGTTPIPEWPCAEIDPFRG